MIQLFQQILEAINSGDYSWETNNDLLFKCLKFIVLSNQRTQFTDLFRSQAESMNMIGRADIQTLLKQLLLPVVGTYNPFTEDQFNQDIILILAKGRDTQQRCKQLEQTMPISAWPNYLKIG